ncbi:MAG: NAD(P)-dependent oxidoreductase [Myxococcota bacterium]
MRPLLLTGAAGVLGRALSPLLNGGCRPLDRLLGEDLAHRKTTRSAVRGCRGVIHLAACARVGRCEADPEAAFRDNVTATANVLDAAAAEGAWVLLVSSREVYGQPDLLPAGPGTALRPQNVYGRTKAGAEALAEGRNVAVVRLANVYGAAGDHPDRLVPGWLAAARTGAPLQVRGADHTLDLVHVDDVLDGLLRVVARLDAGHTLSTLLLCSGEETRLGDLARALKGSSPLLHVPAAPHEVRRFVGDPAPAFATLGWRPRISLSRGLAALQFAPPHEASK